MTEQNEHRVHMLKAGFFTTTIAFAAAMTVALSAADVAQAQAEPRQEGQGTQESRPVVPTGLSSHERALAATVPDCQVVERENIVVLWRGGMKVTRVPESGVSNPEQLADWLEQAYRFMRLWTFHDPNSLYGQKTGERHRLAFVWNGRKHFNVGGARPYIGLQNPPLDTNWYGYICHEMSHDFFHAHPDFRGRLTGWNEAACDYSRYYLLRALGMAEAARQWEKALYRADPNSRYRGKARQLLDLERKSGWDGPGEFWRNLKGKDINLLIGGAKAELELPTEEAEAALVAAWDFEGADSLVDKAPSGVTRDDLTAVGAATIQDGIALLPAAAALQAASSADLELTGAMTVWARFRVRGVGPSILSLIDKRRFKSPEARSYGLLLLPSAKAGMWGLGGSISGDGTRKLALNVLNSQPSLPVDEWRAVAMVARRVGGCLSVSWLASTNDQEVDMEYVVVSGPASVATLDTIFRGSQPLFIGNDANLTVKAATIEFDEVRLYNRALNADELLSIMPGELSEHGAG